MKQLAFDVPQIRRRRRRRAGRVVNGVPHRARPFHDRHHPAHVTWRIAKGIPSLRKFLLARAVGTTFRAITQSHARRRTSFRVTHFSIQSNHIHLIVEAGSKTTLMRGLRGLGIWLARRVNERLGRHGQVLAERYHARPLTTPLAVRNAIVYVLQNHRHHRPSRWIVDECSSARWFAGWAEPMAPADTPAPVAPARTWLGSIAWRRHGRIRFDEAPASPGPRTPGPGATTHAMRNIEARHSTIARAVWPSGSRSGS